MTVDGYRKRVAKVPLPLGASNASSIVVLARRWTEGSEGLPFEATLCTIPDSPAARNWFKNKVVKGDSSKGQTKARVAGATSNAAMTYDVMTLDEECDPETAIIPCEGDGGGEDPLAPYTGEGWWDGDNFPESTPADSVLVDPTPSALGISPGGLTTATACTLYAHYVHESGSGSGNLPFQKLLQGKAELDCNGTALFVLRADIQRYRCFLWVFCSWPTVSQTPIPFPYLTQNKIVIGQASCWDGNYRTKAVLWFLAGSWSPSNFGEKIGTATHIECPFPY